MQPSETTIDYSAVEQALAHNEANARMRVMTGQGLRALGVMIGAGLLALALGVAWYIAKEPKIETVEKTVEVEKIVEVPVDRPVLPQTTPVPDGSPIVRNYLIFQDVSSKVGGRTYNVTTGHEYASSKQRNYDTAFCYTRRTVNGMSVRINLSTKVPGSRPLSTFDPGATNAGLSSQDLNELRSLCPYL